VLRNQIRATPEYRELSAREQAAEATQQGRQAQTLGEAMEPVLNWEKGDVEFWLQVAQLVVLVFILRELRGS
jgi:hypothetical protein